MKKISIALLIAAMILPSVNLQARTWYDDDDEDRMVPLTYAYPITIELSLGYAGSPYTVKGDMGNATGVLNGASFNFRFSGMFSKHVGAFFQLGLAGTGASDYNYFGTLNRADGDMYRYSGYTADCQYLPSLLVGPVARYDFGKCSLRPRVGIGVTWYSTYENSYKRIGRDKDPHTDPATYFNYYYSQTGGDFLIDADGYSGNYFVPSFVVSPSLQLTYTIRTHCFFSVEAGYNILTKRMTEAVYRAESVSAYNPETFVEELYFSDYIGTWCEGPGALASRTVGRARDFFYVNVGIGWNIGHNRNQRGSYYHKY